MKNGFCWSPGSPSDLTVRRGNRGSKMHETLQNMMLKAAPSLFESHLESQLIGQSDLPIGRSLQICCGVAMLRGSPYALKFCIFKLDHFYAQVSKRGMNFLQNRHVEKASETVIVAVVGH